MTSSTEVNSVLKYISSYNLTQYDTGEAAASPDPVTSKPDMGVCPYEYPAIELRYTMIGKEVKWLQWTLCKAGYDLKIDGIFGPKTLAAVKDFQKKSSLKVDGIAGRLTKAELKRI